MIEFSQNLKEARKTAGYTQEQMAKKLGISFRTYQNYELVTNNNREPDLATLCKIAKTLDVSVDYLLGIKVYWVRSLPPLAYEAQVGMTSWVWPTKYKVGIQVEV